MGANEMGYLVRDAGYIAADGASERRNQAVMSCWVFNSSVMQCSKERRRAMPETQIM